MLDLLVFGHLNGDKMEVFDLRTFELIAKDVTRYRTTHGIFVTHCDNRALVYDTDLKPVLDLVTHHCEALVHPNGRKVIMQNLQGEQHILYDEHFQPLLNTGELDFVDDTDSEFMFFIRVAGGFRVLNLWDFELEEHVFTVPEKQLNLLDGPDRTTFIVVADPDQNKLALHRPDGSLVATVADAQTIELLSLDGHYFYSVVTDSGVRILDVRFNELLAVPAKLLRHSSPFLHLLRMLRHFPNFPGIYNQN